MWCGFHSYAELKKYLTIKALIGFLLYTVHAMGPVEKPFEDKVAYQCDL